jgi:uncharacterized membrane protein YesL
MGLFNNYTKEGKGVSKNQNTPRLVLFFQILFRKFWSLIVVNLLYFVFCIPVVTIGPATAGMTKILRNYAREEHAFIWGDFIETFKKNFKQAFLYSVLDLLVSAFLFLDFVAAMNMPLNVIMRGLSFAAIFLGAFIWTVMRYYIYSMMITFRLSLKELLKNAFIFCWAGFIRNIFITAVMIGVLYLVLSIRSMLLMLFVFVFLFFAFMWFFVNFMVNPLIKKHMIDGFDPETGKRIEEEKYEGFEDVKK